MNQQLLPEFSRRLGLFTALVSLALTTPTFGQSVWTGTANNEFSEGANWNPNLPGETDTATVNSGSPQVTNEATIDRLGVNGGNVTITNTGALTVTSGSTITSGSVGINAGGVLNSDVDLNGGSLGIDGTLNGKLNLSNGNVTVNGALGSASVGVGTALSNNGTVGDVSVSSGGTFANNSSGTAGALTNAGTASNAGTIESLTNTAGNFTNNAGGTITGKTTVSGGTVTNNFVVTDADVAAAAAFVNNAGATAGAIRNSGSVTNTGTIASFQNDAGNFTNNSGGVVTGLTTVSGGTVTNNFIVTDVDVAEAAAFVNNTGATAGDVRNSGTVTNAGTVASVQNDDGTFTNNVGGVVTGATTVYGGTVTNNFVVTDADVAAAAAFVNNAGATAGAIRNSGMVTNAGTIASLQNDGGLFTNNGGGEVTGTTKIDGGTIVNNATLANIEIGKQGTFTNNNGAAAGTVTNAGTAANDGTIASLVNTDGYFSNTGTITGGATVTSGELVNQGTVAGTIDIFDGGLLSGSGVSGGLTVNAGGILSPGPGIATLDVTGNLTFHTGSTYQLDINANGLSDRINAGTINIDGGTLDIRAATGTYKLSTDYTILTANSITGTFDSIASDFAFLSPTLTYGGTSVDLSLDRNAVRFQDVALTANDRATAAAVEDFGVTNTLFSAILPLDIQTAQSAFSQLNGEIHASLKSAFIKGSQFSREAIIDQMNERKSAPADDVSFWTSGILAQDNFASDGNARAFDTSIAGTFFGADVAVSDHWRLGGVLGYSHLAAQPQASADSYHVGLYAAGDIGPLNVVGGAIHTKNEVSTQRDIAFGTFTDQLSAKYDSAITQVFGDISWTLEEENLSIQPFANLAYVSLDTDDFNERGGAAALSVSGGTSDVSLSTLGIRWSAALQTSDLPVVASGTIGWRHAAGDLTPDLLTSFAGGSPFILEGITIPKNSLVLKAGITAHLSKSARLSLTYSGEFAGGFQSNTAHANLSIDF
ncbi:autotransporter outer membrane beta-barrel domain-containing protein [Agrobacterium rosae]|uniref:Autotransporter domain-containing protein n=1 Tax=Agrobacterium rosae TaxID=1972867 RepID=A0AAE5RVK4_9HYPH|nr:autotransporter domain-containing protein [Agrobacterium rosae]MCM2431421.1 autotransporter domain-containing protein [Agrobacterium rosae]MDX8328913.1 autotransporter domain-containing protein [Agrobacterium rosae]POO50181.1 autotransporter outer membrane beta-barrel domain-containing protein [Agrobacterium rosae]